MKMSNSTDLENPGIFDGLTAWFSSSVDKDILNIWKANDGDLADVDVAMLVFSEDAEAPDTKRLYNSTAYLNENLAIFHATYISECVKCGNTKSVSIGNYLLPPSALYEKIKNNVKYSYIYTKQEASHSKNASNADENNHRQVKQNGTMGKSPRSSRSDFSGYIDVESLPAVREPLVDFEVGRNGCEVTKK